jgi:hypothetical protein
MTWEPVSTSAAPVKGARYRWSAFIRLPYAKAPVVRGVVSGALKVAAATGAIALEGVDSYPPAASSSGVLSDRWRLEARWRALVGGSAYDVEPPSQAGLGQLVALVVGALLAGFGAVYILSKLEREVVSPLVEDARKLLEPLLNPGALVLALVGVFLVLRARR